MYPGLQPQTPTFVSLTFQVDGNIVPSIVHNVTDAGANMIVFGSAIISTNNVGDMISLFQSSVDAVVAKRMAYS